MYKTCFKAFLNVLGLLENLLVLKGRPLKIVIPE
jgi:hypothetical protein